MNRASRPFPADSHLRATDPRPARTREMILDAIKRLGADQQDITVASVVSAAGLSRSSFYSQFSEIGDVAVQLLSETRTRVQLELESHPERSAEHEAIRALIEEFDQRRLLYRAVLGTGCTMQTARSICRILIDWVYGDLTELIPERSSVAHASAFIAAGTLGVLTGWVLSDTPCSPESIEAELLDLIPTWPRVPAGPERQINE